MRYVCIFSFLSVSISFNRHINKSPSESVNQCCFFSFVGSSKNLNVEKNNLLNEKNQLVIAQKSLR